MCVVYVCVRVGYVAADGDDWDPDKDRNTEIKTNANTSIKPTILTNDRQIKYKQNQSDSDIDRQRMSELNV